MPRSIAVRDPALPALEELFPASGAPGFVHDFARELWPLDGNTPKVRYARYKPASECVALWSVATESGPPLLLTAKLFAGNKGAEIVQRLSFQRLASEARQAAGADAPLYRYLPERRALLQVFPLDSKLRGLPFAASTGRMAGALARALGVAPEALRVIEAAPLRYKAWHRCVLRYRVEIGGAEHVFFGKLFRDDRGEAMLPRLRALKAQLEAHDVPWLVPVPVAYLPEPRLLLLEEVRHQGTLKALLERGAADLNARSTLREQIRLAAEGLLRLQRIELTGVPVVTAQDSLGWLGDKAKAIGEVAPALADALLQRLARLEGEARALPEEPLVPAHGAFRHTQMLNCGERVGLIDLDELRLSGAAADAGDFLGCLDRMALRRPSLRPEIADVEAAFSDVVSEHLNPGWLAWYRTTTQLKLTIRSFQGLKWTESAKALLAQTGQGPKARLPRTERGDVEI